MDWFMRPAEFLIRNPIFFLSLDLHKITVRGQQADSILRDVLERTCLDEKVQR